MVWRVHVINTRNHTNPSIQNYPIINTESRPWHYLISKYNNGYITTGEAPGQMYIPGYPVWWLKAAGYDKWPGAARPLPNVLWTNQF